MLEQDEATKNGRQWHFRDLKMRANEAERRKKLTISRSGTATDSEAAHGWGESLGPPRHVPALEAPRPFRRPVRSARHHLSGKKKG